MNKYVKYWKGVLVVCLVSLMLVGCGIGSSDTLTTGYYKNAAIKTNGEFVIKDKVDDDKATDGGIYYYVELGKEEATKDKVIKITSMSGGIPIDVPWKSAEGNETFATMSKVTVDYSQDGYIKQSYEKTTGDKGLGANGEAAVRYKIAQDGENKGKVERIYYYDSDGNNKAYGDLAQAAISYTKQGQIAELSYLDKNGSKTTGLWGANKLGFLYDKEKPDVFIGFEIRDHNGTPIDNGMKYSRIAYEFNKDGRVIDKKLLNKTGELDGSALKKVYIQLDQGDILQNHLSLIRQGIFFSSAETKYTYDDKHSGPVKISFFGIDGQPSASELDLKGVAAIEIGYDDKDRVNNLKFIGTDGQSVSPEIYGAKGPDEVKIEYDDKGNISKDIFYRNGEPTAYPFSKDETSDVAAIETKYDEQRRKTELSYLNKTGAPTYRTIYGTLKYYGMKYTYTGNISNLSYLDSSGTEFKAEPSAVLIGSWKQQGSPTGYTWVINKDGTMKILRPQGQDSTHTYTTSEVYISRNGTGTLHIEISGVTGASSDLLTFKTADRFELQGIFDTTTFVRQNN